MLYACMQPLKNIVNTLWNTSIYYTCLNIIFYYFFGRGGGPKVYIVIYEHWCIVYYSYNFIHKFCVKYDNLKRIVDFHTRSIISA